MNLELQKSYFKKLIIFYLIVSVLEFLKLVFFEYALAPDIFKELYPPLEEKMFAAQSFSEIFDLIIFIGIVATLIVTLTGTYLTYKFRNLGRIFLLASCTVLFLIEFIYMNILVSDSLDYVLGSLAWSSFGAIIYCSYFTILKDEFH